MIPKGVTLNNAIAFVYRASLGWEGGLVVFQDGERVTRVVEVMKVQSQSMWRKMEVRAERRTVRSLMKVWTKILKKLTQDSCS